MKPSRFNTFPEHPATKGQTGLKSSKVSKDRSSSKSNTARLFRRYVWLVSLIQRASRITFEDINNHWLNSSINESGEDLPLKTFHNHIAAIEDMFGINIKCNRNAGYTYYIENSADIDQDGITQWLLNSFTVSNLLTECKNLRDRIIFEEIPQGPQYLTQIIEAMRDSLTMEITYQSFFKDEASTFEVEPYCVKAFKQRWYMVAHSEISDTPRIYALDRIHEIKTTANHFCMPKDFDPAEYFAFSYGIIVNEEYDIERVVIKAKGSQVKYLRSLPLHFSQREIKSTDEYSIFEYTLRPTTDFQQELLAHDFDDEIEVLAPEWLIDTMKNIGYGIATTHMAPHLSKHSLESYLNEK